MACAQPVGNVVQQRGVAPPHSAHDAATRYGTHVPFAQTSFDAHCRPQTPQWFASRRGSKHDFTLVSVLRHSMRPLGHAPSYMHDPAMQRPTLDAVE